MESNQHEPRRAAQKGHRRHARRLACCLVLTACAGYQVEPYAEVQLRDETFSDGSRDDTYEGNTFMVGARYVPPVRLDATQATRFETAWRGLPAPPQITVEGAESEVGGLTAAVKDIDWTWPMVAALLVVAWTARELKRKPNAKPE